MPAPLLYYKVATFSPIGTAFVDGYCRDPQTRERMLGLRDEAVKLNLSHSAGNPAVLEVTLTNAANEIVAMVVPTPFILTVQTKEVENDS